jgi:outer membrane protein assembly factor BamB
MERRMLRPRLARTVGFVLAALAGTSCGGGDDDDSGNDGSTSNRTIRVVKEGTGSGIVTSVPAGIDCGAVCSATFGPGTVRVTAVPDAGSEITFWNGCPVVENRYCDVEITGGFDVDLTIRFEPVVPTPPDPPRDPVAESPEPGSMRVVWGAPDAADYQYRLYLAAQSGVNRTNHGTLPEGRVVEAAVAAATVTGLEGDKTYYAVVTALNTVGESAESVEASIWVPAIPPDRRDWVLTVGSAIYYSSPAIAADGTIYVGTGAPFSPSGVVRGLYAVHPDGTEAWHVDFGANTYSPVVGDDGTIYVLDAMGPLHAVDPGGTEDWSYPMPFISSAVGHSTPALGADGTIYAASNTLYAIHPDGTLDWSWTPTCSGDCSGILNNYVGSSPAVRADGSIIVAMNGEFVLTSGGRADSAILAFDPTGTPLWMHFLEASTVVFSSPAIGADGAVYVGTESLTGGGGVNSVLALEPDGSERWRYVVPGDQTVRSSPALAADGTVYVGLKSGPAAGEYARMLALDTTGSEAWRYDVTVTGADVYCSPAIGADGTIYFGAESTDVYALDGSGVLLWSYSTVTGGINWSSAAIAPDGTLYIGNNNGELSAIDTVSLGLAASSWPRFHRDNRSTGRAAP